MIAVFDSMEMTAFPLAYLTLSGERTGIAGSNITQPGFSRRSLLIDTLLGLGAHQGEPPHPQGVEALTPEERRLFTNWVDLGAQYR